MNFLSAYYKLLPIGTPAFLLVTGLLLLTMCHNKSFGALGLVHAVTSEQAADTVSDHRSGPTSSQTANPAPSHTSRIGISQTLGTPETPFWLHANRDGRIPLHSAKTLLLFGEFHRSFLHGSKAADLDTGFRIDTRLSDGGNRLGFSELYAHLNIRGWQLSAGRFYDTMGLAPDYLSTGSMLMSRNALPPFKLRLSTPGFLPVPLTGGVLSFKARWSEGVLTDDRWVDGARVHQKYLYLKIQPVRNLNLIAGIAHNLMWGGTSPELGSMHPTFREWMRDVAARPDQSVFVNETPVGNGLGGYDFGVEYGTDTWSAGLYRMFYIEDAQSLAFSNPWDGIWSAFIDRHDGERPHRLVSYVLYEHINTKKQDADWYDALGRGRYYSHYVYRDGWIHHGQVIGTPLVLIDPERIGIRDRILVNNIILAHHVGVSGHLGEQLSYRLVATYSRNYGVCHDQNSGRGCNGSVDEPMQERETYVPFRDLRRDRYSFMMRMSFPVAVLRQVLFRSPEAAGSGAHSEMLYAARPDEAGRSGTGRARGLQMHLSAAIDAGAFHDRPLLGFELGFTLPM